METCSKWPKMRTLMARANEVHVRPRPDYASDSEPTLMCPTCLLGVDQTPLDLGMTGSPSEPMVCRCPTWLTTCPWCATPREVIPRVQGMMGTEVYTHIIYLGQDVNRAQHGDRRPPLDIMTDQKMAKLAKKRQNLTQYPLKYDSISPAWIE